MANEKRLIEIPSDGIIRIPIMNGEDTVGERCIDLSHLPTVDAVEVVRCKDCKHGCEDHEDAYLCNNAYYGLIGFTRGEDFCSYGERRTDG